MRLGSQTFTLVSVTEDLDAPRDSYGNPPKVRTETAIMGCRIRPLTSAETQAMGLGEKVSDPWRITCPATPAVVAARNTDEILNEGVRYSLIGLPRIFNDAHGPFKASLIVERHLG